VEGRGTQSRRWTHAPIRRRIGRTERARARCARLTRVPVNCRTLLLVSLRKCDETVSYHLYIVTRYLCVLVPHTIRICL
jgi:hypothetical protein